MSFDSRVPPIPVSRLLYLGGVVANLTETAFVSARIGHAFVLGALELIVPRGNYSLGYQLYVSNDADITTPGALSGDPVVKHFGLRLLSQRPTVAYVVLREPGYELQPMRRFGAGKTLKAYFEHSAGASAPFLFGLSIIPT